MSDKMKALMWDYPAETPAEKLIGLKMGDISNDQGRSIYFATGTYAKAACVTKRGARKIIARMREWKIVLADPDMAVQLAVKGKTVRGEVYRLNVVRIREYILAQEIMETLFGEDAEAELSSPSEGEEEGIEAELSSALERSVEAELSSVEAELSSGIYPYKESIQTSPCSPPSPDYADDFEKLWSAWTPFEMLHGDRPEAEKAYEKVRSTGIGAEQIVAAARAYCQACRINRCKTKHIEKWLAKSAWQPEQKGLGGNANGKSSAKKPASAHVERVYVAIDGDGNELKRWWPHEAPNQWVIDREYPGCKLRIRDATEAEIAELQTATGEKNGEEKITA